MARPRKAGPVLPTTGLVAAAINYPGSKAPRIYRPTGDWQAELWRQYDRCPELRFAVTWAANACSRVELFAGQVQDDGTITPNPADKELTAVLHDIFGGPVGTPERLHAFALHLSLVGEVFLVRRTVEGTPFWEVIGQREMKVTGTQWAISYGDGTPLVTLVPTDVVIRIWRAHPGRRIEADSSMRAALPTLQEIELFDMHIQSQQTSRIASAGLLPIPASLTTPPPPTSSPDREYSGAAEGLMVLLGETMSEALKDVGSAAAQVPVIVSVPDDLLEKMPKEPIKFWSDFDAQVIEGRKDAIERFGVGADMPPEVIFGMTHGASSSGGKGTGASHWMGWQIEESAIKMHIEPLIELIISAIVMSYIRPVLKGDPRRAIAFSTDKLKARPDRSKEALELYDVGQLSEVSLRRENGFGEDDAPTDDERKLWLLRKVASGSATPDQVGEALRLLGIEMPVPDPTQQTREARPAPSLEEHPAPRGMPDTYPNSLLLAAAEPLVYRALERCGNRMRQMGSKPPGVKAAKVYLYHQANGSTPALLADAWEAVPELLGAYGDPDKITEALESYCQMLLAEQVPHDRKRLAKYLELV